MNRQDRQGVRTPADLEQKYQFGKRFAEIMGIALDAQKSITVIESELRSTILDQVTSITRDTEKIVMAAMESYVEKGDFEQLEATVHSELEVMAEQISMNFTSTIERITEVDGDVQSVVEDLEKHFEFSVDGLVIKAGENSMTLTIDNDRIVFKKNGLEFGSWDGVNFHTGNIIIDVTERAQFGNFAFIPRSDGSLSFLKVGG